MPLRFKHYHYAIDPQQGLFLRENEESPRYPSRIVTADVVLCSFNLQFLDADHHIADVMASAFWTKNVNDNPSSSYVEFTVSANLADRTNTVLWGGHIDVLVIAEIE